MPHQIRLSKVWLPPNGRIRASVSHTIHNPACLQMATGAICLMGGQAVPINPSQSGRWMQLSEHKTSMKPTVWHVIGTYCFLDAEVSYAKWVGWTYPHRTAVGFPSFFLSFFLPSFFPFDLEQGNELAKILASTGISAYFCKSSISANHLTVCSLEQLAKPLRCSQRGDP